MSDAPLSISRRTRATPFTRRVTEAGVKAWTVYNHMLLPTVFETLEADYHHLKTHVQLWDVACERQVEIRGADAARLTQMLTPRDLSASLLADRGLSGGATALAGVLPRRGLTRSLKSI